MALQFAAIGLKGGFQNRGTRWGPSTALELRGRSPTPAVPGSAPRWPRAPRRSADGNVLLTGGTELILALLRFMNTTMAQSPRPARLQLHPAFDRRPRWVRGVCAEAGRVVAYLPLLSTPSHSL